MNIMKPYSIFKAGWFLIFLCCCNQAEQSKERTSSAASYDEALLKTFVLSTHHINESEATKKLDSILKESSNDSAIFKQTIAYLETPFGNPNSAFRNENLYSELLQAKIKSPWVDSLTKQVVKNRLYLVMQNRVGEAANDFTYITPSGLKKRMYDIKATFLLIYFNNPECNACKEMKALLKSSVIISQKIQSGQLRILAIYPDPDVELWKRHLPEMPGEWLQGRDDNQYLWKNKLYDLRAIPTLYLLDQDKKVLLKDAMDLQKIEYVLQSVK